MTQKKKTNNTPKSISGITEVFYLPEDAVAAYKLFKHYGRFSGDQENFIHYFLKRYVNPGEPRPCSGCDSPMGFASAFIRMREWFNENKEKFEPVRIIETEIKSKENEA